MAFDLLLDTATRDLSINSTTGDLDLVSGELLVAQRIAVKLRAHLGEWLLDTSFGINYRGEVLVKNPDLARLSSIFRAAIASCPGVAFISSFTIDLVGRSLTIRFDVEVEEGTVEEEVSFIAEVDVISGIASFMITARPISGVLSFTVA